MAFSLLFSPLHLGEAIDASIHKDIINVYTNLTEGSNNHLAAFTRELAKY